MAGEDRIAVDGVSKVYGELRAVDDVSLTVEPGCLHCLVGPNGSGKTTLFRLLAGLTNPTEGRVDRPADGMGVGFQQPTFYREFTVAENLDVFADLVDADPEWRATLEDRFDVDRIRHRESGALSGGQANKVDLVRLPRGVRRRRPDGPGGDPPTGRVRVGPRPPDGARERRGGVRRHGRRPRRCGRSGRRPRPLPRHTHPLSRSNGGAGRTD
jgi:ATPase subunit of ABC transporter with duplicated ATPase domains